MGNQKAAFTLLSVTIAVQVGLRVRSSIGESIGSLQEIERLESAWGMESPTPPPITPFADSRLF